MKTKAPSKPAAGTPDADWLSATLKSIQTGRVTVLGDFCLDAYWMLDENMTEHSVETGLEVRRVNNQQYSLGGAANVAANLSALGVAKIRAVGLIGEDAFAKPLRALLEARGIDTSGLLAIPHPWQTTVFAKPFNNGKEMNRFDFGAANTVSPDYLARLLNIFERAVADSDAVVINQQVLNSVVSPKSIVQINKIIEKYPAVTFLVDSRQHASEFSNVIIKANTHEIAELVGEKKLLTDVITQKEAFRYATALTKQTGKPVFATRGKFGLVVADADRIIDVPGIQTMGKTDPVGAGDTIVSALAATLGVGIDLKTAAELANLAATITVCKMRTTGTASTAELLEAGPFPDYIYAPELAKSLRLAQYLGNTEIEIINRRPATAIKHAIFDHDGTLSTLRQGWEKIMEPVMMKGILGQHLSTVSEDIYRKVEEDVRMFIDQTTGIQTLAQMKGLIALVREYGFVPESEILDEHGYKAIYNKALLKMVHTRMRKIKLGELDPQDFEIKGAHNFLETLHSAGVKMYLASGTDEQDVKDEAKIMGYAHLFDGRICGAVGDLKVEAKRIVLERILNDGGLSGPEVLVVGDGPVEIREGKKRGTLCLGVASDEFCRYGLNETKRSRIICAGADYVIPDYSQRDNLIPLLGLQIYKPSPERETISI